MYYKSTALMKIFIFLYFAMFVVFVRFIYFLYFYHASSTYLLLFMNGQKTYKAPYY